MSDTRCWFYLLGIQPGRTLALKTLNDFIFLIKSFL